VKRVCRKITGGVPSWLSRSAGFRFAGGLLPRSTMGERPRKEKWSGGFRLATPESGRNLSARACERKLGGGRGGQRGGPGGTDGPRGAREEVVYRSWDSP